MEELPNELLELIFKQLSLVDLITSCRLVCKRLRSIVDQLKIDELSIFTCHYDSIVDSSWFYTNRPIDRDRSIHSENFKFDRFFASDLAKRNRQCLKRFSLDAFSYLHSERLNEFAQLEELCLDMTSICSRDRIAILNFKNLKILHLTTNPMDDGSKARFDCPALKRLQCKGNLGLIEFKNPSTIDCLVLINRDFGHFKVNYDLARFRNVKAFRFDDRARKFIWAESLLDLITVVRSWSKLEELHFCVTNFRIVNQIDQIVLDKINRCKEFIYGLIELKSRLSVEHDFRFYLQGMEIRNRRFFENLNFGHIDHLFRLQIQNYLSLADRLCYYTEVNYSDLERHFGHSFPTNFFDKFNNIQTVSADRVVNQDHFICFLKRCTNLINLSIQIDYIAQPFLDQLPYTCRNLSKFSVKKGDERDCGFKGYSYKFLVRMDRLRELNIDQFDFDPILGILPECKVLVTIKFYIHKAKVLITKMKRDLYNFESGLPNKMEDQVHLSFKKGDLSFGDLKRVCMNIRNLIDIIYS